VKLPAAALQKALFATLRADPQLIAFFKGPPRIYDKVPVDDATGQVTATFPFVHLGEDDASDDGDGCEDGAETHFTLHIWSRAVGKLEARDLADLVARAADADIDPEGHAIVVHQIVRARDIDAGDGGRSTHRIVVPRYVTATPLT
jgi:hypothetical protein